MTEEDTSMRIFPAMKDRLDRLVDRLDKYRTRAQLARELIWRGIEDLEHEVELSDPHFSAACPTGVISNVGSCTG